MADNYVSIKIKASDTAKPDLDTLKFELDALGAKVETARVDVDDKDAAAKLLALNARLVALDKKVANPRLDAAGAAKIEADIAAVDAALDHLNDKHAKPEVTLKGAAEVLAEVAALDHELDKLDRKAEEAGPGGLLGKLLGGTGGGGGAAGAASAGEGVMSNPYGLAAIAGGVATLLPELLGLVSGFAAAGAGAGAFALLAGPAVKQVETAYTGLSAAQKKYQDAQDKEAADPSKAHAKAVHDAAVNLQLAQDAIKKMPADAQGAIGSIRELTSHFANMAQTLAPDVFKVFNAGLKVVNQILPAVLPFASTFAEVLDKLLGQAGKFAGSKGFQDWIGQFHGLEGPALGAIGHGIGQVVVQIGKLLTVMSAKDVVNALNLAFNVLSGTIDGLRHVIEGIMRSYDNVSRTMQRDSHDIAVSFDSMRHSVANTFDTVRHGLAESGHDWAVTFDGIRHGIADFAHNIASHFDEIRANLHRWVMDAQHDVDMVADFFRALPGRILAAIGNFGSLLFDAGRALIQGLINGIKSMFSALGSVASSIGHFIASLKGPLPADLLLLVPHGQAIMQGLMNGMASRLPDLRSQLAGISSTIGGTQFSQVPGWGQLAGGGGGAVQLQVTAGGASEFEQFMLMAVRKWVRVKGGGDVQKAFGT